MNKILIVFVTVALGAGVYWYATQSLVAPIEMQDLSSVAAQTQGTTQSAPSNVATNATQDVSPVADERAGVSWGSFDAPAGWRVEYSAQQNTYTAYSPDFAAADLSAARLGHGLNSTGKGMTIEIGDEGSELDPSIQTPATYVAFAKGLAPDCSNCVEAREILLDGIPAFFVRSTAEDHGGGASATTVVNGRGVSVHFTFAEYDKYVARVIADVLASFDIK